MELGEFAEWARRPAPNVVVLAEEAAHLSARTVNRMLSGVVGFYEFQARRGSTLAKDLVVKTRSGRGGYKPFPHGIARARPRGRAVRLPERRSLPQTLSLEQVAAVIDCQRRLRDRFLFALLASTVMRIGQALGLRHEDVVAWERRVVIRAREDAPRRARSKGGAEGGVPVPAELMRLPNDYMHEEYGDLNSDFVFGRKIGLTAYGAFLIVRSFVSGERADPDLRWARFGLPLPPSVDNVAAGTALGLAGYSPWLAPILFAVLTFAMSVAGHQIGRTAAHFFDFIPRINADLLAGIGFAAMPALMAFGVALPLSGD